MNDLKPNDTNQGFWKTPSDALSRLLVHHLSFSGIAQGSQKNVGKGEKHLLGTSWHSLASWVATYDGRGLALLLGGHIDKPISAYTRCCVKKSYVKHSF